MVAMLGVGFFFSCLALALGWGIYAALKPSPTKRAGAPPLLVRGLLVRRQWKLQAGADGGATVSRQSVVQFTTKAGQLIEAVPAQAGTFSFQEPGDPVWVLYNPDQPREFRLVSEWDAHSLP